jgi:hypothetical protein
MTQNEEYKEIAEEIIEAVNKTTNDYDARERVTEILEDKLEDKK